MWMSTDRKSNSLYFRYELMEQGFSTVNKSPEGLHNRITSILLKLYGGKQLHSKNSWKLPGVGREWKLMEIHQYNGRQ